MKGFNMKKKRKGEHKTWASFRYIPNDEEGQEFMRMFKKYRNPEVIGKWYKKGRKPANGRYDAGGNANLKVATEFSLYVYGFNNPNLDFESLRHEVKYWKYEQKYWNEKYWDLMKSHQETSIWAIIIWRIKLFIKRLRK